MLPRDISNATGLVRATSDVYGGLDPRISHVKWMCLAYVTLLDPYQIFIFPMVLTVLYLTFQQAKCIDKLGLMNSTSLIGRLCDVQLVLLTYIT